MRTELLEGPHTSRGVSLPARLDQELKELAKRNHRSVSGEIQLALVKHISPDNGTILYQTYKNEGGQDER